MCLGIEKRKLLANAVRARTVEEAKAKQAEARRKAMALSGLGWFERLRLSVKLFWLARAKPQKPFSPGVSAHPAYGQRPVIEEKCLCHGLPIGDCPASNLVFGEDTQ